MLLLRIPLILGIAWRGAKENRSGSAGNFSYNLESLDESILTYGCLKCPVFIENLEIFRFKEQQ